MGTLFVRAPAGAPRKMSGPDPVQRERASSVTRPPAPWSGQRAWLPPRPTPLTKTLSLSLSPPSPLFSQADPPDAAKLPPGDVVGVTALLLTCSYQAKEFLRVGYYVNVEYADEALREAPPERPVVER